MKIWTPALLLILPMLAAAQASVEAAAATAGSATSAAGSGQKIGKGIAGALDKLSGTLEKSTGGKTEAKPAATKAPSARASRSTAASKAPEVVAEKKVAPEPQYESPSGIQEGMESAELARRFGPPALKISSGAGELYSYVGKDGTSAEATVREGKVVSVRSSGASVTPQK